MQQFGWLNFNHRFHIFELIAVGLFAMAVTLTLGIAMMPSPPRDSRTAVYQIKSNGKLLPVPFAPPSEDSKQLFKGGGNSLVARIVGHAEGTRSANGEKTTAYSGHRDPGNSVWNLGYFSYQHSAVSPQDADRKQLARLEGQFVVIEEQARKRGIDLSIEEKLNAIDLANQAPLAALEPGGFIDRLKECKRELVCVRSQSFIDNETGRLDAPGLGNNMNQVRADQKRRIDAINSTFAIMMRVPSLSQK